MAKRASNRKPSAGPLVGIIMGSRSDWETMRHAAEMLAGLGVAHEVRVVSAHRTPDLLFEYASAAAGRGIEVIIAGAGGAAHLPGMCASKTALPVLGVPVESRALKGLDSLLSIAQMPAGIPVGTLAIGAAGAKNAGLLAAAILGGKHPGIRGAVERFRFAQTKKVLGDSDPRKPEKKNPTRSVGVPRGKTGATPMIVGVLGGGQLGRMIALAGYPLGVRFRFLDPDVSCPAGQVGELVVGEYEDEKALERFVRGVDVVTYEFENVPARTARWLTEHVPVYPPERALATAQDRIAEKACFELVGMTAAKHEAVDTYEQLQDAVERLGLPCVLKTRRMGYDGKGQAVIRTSADVLRAWAAVGNDQPVKAGLILEAFVSFRRELSMLGVRGRGGATAFYPPTENVHVRGILSRSAAPAPGCEDGTRLAMEAGTGKVMERLGYVGVLGVEFFDLGGGKVVANEMSPRVHNSGHWTVEGAECSQFENHVRAVCGMPLGSTASRGFSLMLNVIGAEPEMAGLLGLPGVHVHMYGKTARPGRKLGHVTVCAGDAERAVELAERAGGVLRNC